MEARLRARIVLFCEHGGFLLLAHDGEAITRSHDTFSVGNLVTGPNDELRGLGTNVFVLGERQGNLFNAVLVAALAEEIGVAAGTLAALSLLNPLVHFAEENLVTAHPLLTLAHAKKYRVCAKRKLARIRLGHDSARLSDLLDCREAIASANDELIG
jgi:hypothetical protein